MAVGAPSYSALVTMSSGDGITWTASVTLPSGTDQLLQVVAFHADSKTINSIAWDGGAPASYLVATAWGIWKAPATGTKTLTIVINAYSSQAPKVLLALFDGVDQTTPVGSVTAGSLPSSTPSTGSITCPSNGTVYGVLFHNYTSTDPSVTSGTAIGTTHDGFSFGHAHAYRESTGAVSWSCSSSGSGYVAGVPINASAGSGPTAAIKSQMLLKACS